MKEDVRVVEDQNIGEEDQDRDRDNTNKDRGGRKKREAEGKGKGKGKDKEREAVSAPATTANAGGKRGQEQTQPQRATQQREPEVVVLDGEEEEEEEEEREAQGQGQGEPAHAPAPAPADDEGPFCADCQSDDELDCDECELPDCLCYQARVQGVPIREMVCGCARLSLEVYGDNLYCLLKTEHIHVSLCVRVRGCASFPTACATRPDSRASSSGK